MDDLMKQRAVGGVVLVALLIIFVPMFVDFGGDEEATDAMVAIPPKPQGEMQTAEIPLSDVGDKRAADFVPPGDMSPEQLIAEAADVDNNVASRDTPPDMEALPPDAAVAPKLAPSAAPAKQPEAAATKPAAAPAKKVPEPKPQLAGPTTGSKAWAVQVGSFTKKENAEKLRDRLRKSGYKAFISKQTSGGKTIVRVRVGPELQRAQADQLRKKIEKEMQMQAKVVEHP